MQEDEDGGGCSQLFLLIPVLRMYNQCTCTKKGPVDDSYEMVNQQAIPYYHVPPAKLLSRWMRRAKGEALSI